MNLSTSDELQLFSKELQQHMSPHALEQLARKAGFCSTMYMDNILLTLILVVFLR